MRDLAGDIDRLASHFQSVAGRRVAYAGSSDAAAVEEGLREFFGKWTHGMEQLHGELSALSRLLTEATDAYEANEGAIVQSARGGQRE
jgi:hypothetical protein